METVAGARVEPGIAPPEADDAQRTALQIDVVDCRDLELSAGGRLYGGGDVHHGIVVEVEPGDRPVRLRLLRLFLDAKRPARPGIEADDAVPCGIVDMVGEDARAALSGGCLAADPGQIVAEKMLSPRIIATDPSR